MSDTKYHLSTIRENFISWHCEDQSGEHYIPGNPEEFGKLFDDAIAAHDRAVKVAALREAAGELMGLGPAIRKLPSEWLNRRADEMEAGQ